MEGKKVFSNDKRYIINTIYDIIELQDGDLILSDAPRGIVYYKLTMYGYEWELIYTITETSEKKCSVLLRLIGDRHDKAQEIRREFALLEAMLGGGADVVIIEN
jgi:hypothetical protein